MKRQYQHPYYLQGYYYHRQVSAKGESAAHHWTRQSRSGSWLVALASLDCYAFALSLPFLTSSPYSDG